ncbi:aminotransferase class I/II-fold pyridoxal phosphate-dependent enzyme [Haloferax volcanii]|uniref:aminotransferase class I/II-fold pyridoxal phosphate-dependent enzyme n=1 Tax=Haloferax volcanii TaxID=2246 RepID=UPI00385AC085
MKPPDFELEEWFDEYETNVEINLSKGYIQGLGTSRFNTSIDKLEYAAPTAGDIELREELGSRYDRSPEEILCTCGAQEANLIAALSILEPGDHTIVVLPTYKSITNIPSVLGDTTTIELNPPDWEVPLERIVASITPTTKLIVMDNPNNPTGKYHEQETIESIYEIAASEDIFLLIDEGYRAIVSEPYDPIAAFGNYGVSIASVTKPYGLAGLRFGWMAANSHIIERATMWKNHTTISPPILSQQIAHQALTDQEDDILSTHRSLLDQNANRIKEFVNRHELQWHPSETSTAFVKIPDSYASGREFSIELVEKQDTLVVPGESFGHNQYIRIGFGISPEILEQGLGRINTLLNS